MVDNAQIKEKATFNAEERKIFQSGLKEFIKRVDECTKIGTTAGSEKRSLISMFDECLKRIEYKANVEFGTGNLKSICGLGFVRKDILRSDCVNTEKFTHTKGLYIYFGYIHSEKKYFLVVGGSDNKNNCVADKIIRSDSKEIHYKNLDIEKITDDFLAMVDYFNHFKVDEFKIQNKGDTMNDKTKIPPLNQILYGPPGTGKTYNTINKALEILGEKIDGKSRAKIKAKFDEYRQNGQIEFVTFHQSFSYEEFVEGIKPNTDNPENMIYEPKAGIFKEICKRALKDLEKIQERIKSNPCVWKVSLEQTDSELYKYCLKNNEIRIGFQHEGGDKNASVRHFRDEMQKGDIVGIRHDEQSFNAIGVIVGDCDEKNIDKMATITETYPITRKIKWILIDNVKNIQDKKLDRNTVYQLDTTVKDLFAEIQDRVGYTFDDLPNQITCKEPYILIIDEINRGNISKILGELITLIEPSKRIGASDEEKARGIGDESLEVMLPYSNDSFGVPSNLYIIGTMNTADRSIALLDTALRRRFEFVEMMPQWDNEHISTDCEGVNLQELLKTMNERIEFLLDREHTIGHSFFIGVDSLDKLREVFKLKIIPLLQEYFYDDYAKIDAVLNYNKMVESKSMGDLGVNLSDDFVDSEKRVYRITDSSAWNATTFTKIYETK